MATMRLDPGKLPTPDELRGLLEEEQVTAADAGRLINISPDSMRRCTQPVESPRYRKLSMAAWELLLLKLNRHPAFVMIDKPDRQPSFIVLDKPEKS